MSSEIFAAVIGAIIGGALSSGTGWWLDRARENQRLENGRRLLTSAIGDDLQHSFSLYDKVSEDWQKQKIIFFSTLNELRESRQTYLNNKDWIQIIENQGLRRDIFRYYLQSADCINLLETLQRRKYDIERRLNETVTNVKFANPSLNDQQAKQTAIGYMRAEDEEYANINNMMPDTVLKLLGFKSKAEKLVQELQVNNAKKK